MLNQVVLYFPKIFANELHRKIYAGTLIKYNIKLRVYKYMLQTSALLSIVHVTNIVMINIP